MCMYVNWLRERRAAVCEAISEKARKILDLCQAGMN